MTEGFSLTFLQYVNWEAIFSYLTFNDNMINMYFFLILIRQIEFYIQLYGVIVFRWKWIYVKEHNAIFVVELICEQLHSKSTSWNIISFRLKDAQNKNRYLPISSAVIAYQLSLKSVLEWVKSHWNESEMNLKPARQNSRTALWKVISWH